MTTTPDRFPGRREEDEILMETNASPLGGQGSISYSGSIFRFEDADGAFDPRFTPDQHKALRQLIHFIDSGPAEGFASGAYNETTYSGVFPTAEVWWESAAKLKKIVSVDTTWSGILITQEVWKMYDSAGSVLVTVTDSVSYSGILETSRTRTVA